MKLRSKTSHSNIRTLGYSILGITISMIASSGWAQQISIPRIDEMPSMPSPYEMRNWKHVAMGYDRNITTYRQIKCRISNNGWPRNRSGF